MRKIGITRKLLVLLQVFVLLMGTCLSNFCFADGYFDVQSFSELMSAVSNAYGDTTITLQSGFTFENTVIIPAGTNVVIRSGNSVQLSKGMFDGALFEVQENASLVLTGSENAWINMNGAEKSDFSADRGILAYGSFCAEYISFRDFCAENGAAICLPENSGLNGDDKCVIQNCSFNGNRATMGGAIFVGSGRNAELTASALNDNTAQETGNSAYVEGVLSYGDNNIDYSANGPQNLELTDHGFVYGSQINGTGVFEISRRTSVHGIVCWGGTNPVPSEIEVILLSDGMKYSTAKVCSDDYGNWEFVFENLPANHIYDIAEYHVDGFRFDKRGEADVGFEVLYSSVIEEETTNVLQPDPIIPSVMESTSEQILNPVVDSALETIVNPVIEATPEPIAEPTMEPMPEQNIEPILETQPTAAPIPAVVTKSPTDETVDEGGYAIFIARADHCSGYIWHVVNKDKTVNLTDNGIISMFPGMTIEGLGTERVKFSNIPAAMDGWSVYAEFVSDAGNVYSDAAQISVNYMNDIITEPVATVTPAELPTPEPIMEQIPVSTIEITPEPTQIPTPTPAPVTTEQPSLQTIQVVAIWNDSMNAANKRPDSFLLELYKDNALYFNATMKSADSWTHVFNNLTGGSYKVKASGISDYSTTYSVSGNTITIINTYIGSPAQPTVTMNPAAPVNTPIYTATPVHTAVPVSTAVPQPSTEISNSNVYPTATPYPVTNVMSTPTVTETESAVISVAAATDVATPINLPKKNSAKMVLWVAVLGLVGVISAGTAIILLKKTK